MNRTRLTTINLYAGAIRLAAFASALTAVEPEPPTTTPTTIIAVLSIAKPITARENPASAITTATPNRSGGAPHSLTVFVASVIVVPISYTERAALAVSDAARLRSRTAAQSSSVIAVRPANVFGPASRWPPSIAMVSPVR